MLLNQNSLKDTELALSGEKDAFFINGERIAFDEVASFFQSMSAHSLNLVYEGRSLEVELHFNSARNDWQASVDSKPTHADKYAQLYQIAYQLGRYRQHQLEIDHKQGETLRFNTKYRRFNLDLTDQQLGLTDHQKHQRWQVSKIIKKDHQLILITDGGGTHRFNLGEISDSESLLRLMQDDTPQGRMPWYQDGDLQQAKTRVVLAFSALGLLVLLGLNGWFGWCCIDNGLIEGLSIIAGMILAIALLVLMLKIIWLNPVARRKIQRENQLEIQAELGELPKPVKPSYRTLWWSIAAWLAMLGVIMLVALSA
ncbi:hypothetical protein [Thiomicrospira microaerophila]|uniref:hypothetical protein n=1 Tax=Thiomicrospira microaerophila TaxID=406020 RepID=UPI0005C9B15A|nr:hypothetical protein [Thiomicrospira microaerophila]